GVVVYSGNGFRRYGNVVMIDHGDGYVTIYAHCQKTLVKLDERVSAGDEIALVGRTGNASAPHLHFEIRLAEKPIHPPGLLAPRVEPAPRPEAPAPPRSSH